MKDFKSLEEVLQAYFGCKKPFLKHPKRMMGGEYVEFFTKKGGKAYENLIQLLEDLAGLDVLPKRAVHVAIETLDEIVHDAPADCNDFDL